MNQTFQAMRRVVESPELAFFASNRSDFFELDFSQVMTWGCSSNEYVWLVKDTGTHLAQLGVDHQETLIALKSRLNDSGPDPARGLVFHIAGHRVRKIKASAALSLLSGPLQYGIEDGYVVRSPSGYKLFRYGVVQCRAHAKAPSVEINFQTVAGAKPTGRDVSALHILASRIATAELSSLFVHVGQIRVDGDSLETAVKDSRSPSKAQRSGR